MTSYTPGPWICDGPESFGPDGHAGVYQAESLGPICWVGDPYPRGENHPYENMRLIAHAPELVEALEAALGYAEDLRQGMEAEASEPGGSLTADKYLTDMANGRRLLAAVRGTE